MRRRMTYLIVLLACGAAVATTFATIEKGTARVNVLQELGRPASAVTRGDIETLSYRNGVRVKLQGGKVVEVTGLEQTPPAAAEAAAAVPAESKPAEVKPDPAPPAPTKEQLAEQEKLEKQQADAEAKSRAAFEKSIAEMENPPPPPPMPGMAPFSPVSFLLEMVLKWALSLAALTLACKYWNSDVPWKGLLLVSLADIVIRAVMGYVGHRLLHMMTLFYADEAVGAFVMVLLLRKVSINQRLSLAVQVMFATKTFSVVVGSFLVTIALRMLA
jgi:hypothetical protein